MISSAGKLLPLSGAVRQDLQLRLISGPFRTRNSTRSFHSSKVRQQNYYGSESSGGSAAGTFIKFIGLTGLAVGVPVGYAVYDPKFRATLEGYLPFTKPIFDRIVSNPSPSKPETKLSTSASPSLPSYARPKPPAEVKKPVVIQKEPPAQKDAEDIDARPDEIVAKTGAKPNGVSANGSSNNLPPPAMPPVDPVKQASPVIAGRKEDLGSSDETKKDLNPFNKAVQVEDRSLNTTLPGRTDFESFLNLLDGRKLTRDEEKLVEAVVNSTVERLEREFEDYVMELEEEHEWDLQLQLRRQIAAHADAVIEALKRQETELEKHFQSRLDRRVEEERQRYNLQVAGALGQILGIQQALNDRTQKDRTGQKAKYLWHVSNAIYDSVRNGSHTGSTSEERSTPLGKYVILAKLFSDSHPFVLSILRAVPEEALVRGIQTEDFLRQRFNQVHKIARRVALIQDDNNGLFRYFLSYLQSVFVRDHHYDLSKLPEIDSAELDTFRILSTASKCVQRGDFESAVKFVGQLKGEPRRVAQDWLKEARLSLETKQIAKLLLAHATSVGLSTVPVDVKK